MRNVCNRKYCLVCSPFGVHNTKQIHLAIKQRNKYSYNVKYQKKERDRRKQLLVGMLGGKCKLCGYDKCLAAIDFHHLDSANKSFEISRFILSKALDAVVEEAKKTIPLCKNCHAEVHKGYRKLI